MRPIQHTGISVLVVSGYLVEDAGGMRLTPRGRLVARVFVAAIKELWRLGPGG